MTTVCYTRQSLAKDDDLLAVSRQLDQCKRVAKARSITIDQELCDNNYSASRRGRPAYERLIKAIEAGQVTQVIILRVDRLLRLNDELEELIKLVENRGLKVITCEGEVDLSTPQGRLIARILVSVARSEVEVKGARHRLANEQRAKSGKPHAGRRAFGYLTDGMTIVEDEALALKELGQRFLSGYTYTQLADWLNASGYVTTMGKQFYGVAVRQMLQRKRYAGIREYDGCDYPAVWPAIWDADTWQRIQHLIRQRAEAAGNRPAYRRHLLTGLLTCGSCGAQMNGTTNYDRKTGERKSAYRCNRERGGCGRVSRGAVPLEWWVKELIVYRLDSPELTRMLEHSDIGVGELMNRQASLNAKLESLLDDYTDGTLTKAEYKRAKERTQAALRDVQAELDRLNYDRTLSGLVSAGESVRDKWEVEDIGWRRQIIDILVERIEIAATRKLPRLSIDGKTYYFDMEAVTISWKV